ncbi:MAG: hypothetical protein FWG92_07025 [Leptospirales bacterium]|nr:hypothetical protein [Leptospirales bacterium]
MKKTNFIVLTIMAMVLALCFASCDGGSDSSSSGESPFISFSGTGYSGKWQSGFGDTHPGIRTEPFASFRSGWTSCIGTRETLMTINYLDRDTPLLVADYFYIAFNNNVTGNYSGDNCIIEIKYASAYQTIFRLSSPVVDITEYNGDVIGGTFSGTDFGGRAVTGSFLFKNVGDGNWYWSQIPFSWPI